MQNIEYIKYHRIDLHRNCSSIQETDKIRSRRISRNGRFRINVYFENFNKIQRNVEEKIEDDKLDRR